MKEVIRELGRTVRAAMRSWPETIRLSVLIAVIATAAWTYYYLQNR